MARQARLDAVGILHHVMIRGIERRNIFRSDADRNDFIGRLSSLLPETKTVCYAWAFLPNHAHFLFRSGPSGMSFLMRRLLTGYVVSFNRRCRRTGQLFQNRCKSIICQEDAYFKELVRYIRLDPLRSNVVSSLSDLDRFPFTGHRALMGRKELGRTPTMRWVSSPALGVMQERPIVPTWRRASNRAGERISQEGDS